jgi:molybdenum cofactor guanylyltransferase
MSALRTPEGITGLILAGGQGARMGGADKGLLLLDGRPLVAHVMDRLTPQVDRILISANRHVADYQALGHAVVGDADPDLYEGPLAGVLAGLLKCPTPLLAVVPCDAPKLPDDLVATLAQALAQSRALLAYAATPLRTHPVFMLCRRKALPSLEDFLAQGHRKVSFWHDELDALPVMFADEAAFANINTPQDLSRLG